MIELAFPWALLLLPLPLLVRWLLPAARQGRGAALRVPFFHTLTGLPGGAGRSDARSLGALVLATLAWVLLVLAGTQPRFLGEPRALETRGRDLMLAIDLSGSMETPDFDVQGQAVSRLAVVNAVARDFVRQRGSDRIGLVLFGTRAYLQAPPTLDHETLIELLDEGEIGLAGEETALGDAIGLAVKHLRELPSEERVLVLLSDGASNTGAVDPLRAAEIAAHEGVRIYTIGIGSGQRTVQTLIGPRVVSTEEDLDEETLARIAESTNGAYFRARDTEGLRRIYRQIDVLEPSQGDAPVLRPSRAFFHWPLAASAGVVSLLVLARFAGEALASLAPGGLAGRREGS